MRSLTLQCILNISAFTMSFLESILSQQTILLFKKCLLMFSVMQLTNNEETDKTIPRHQISPVSLIDHSSILTSFHDGSVPFPRTSGAKFCSVGKVYVFIAIICTNIHHKPRLGFSFNLTNISSFLWIPWVYIDN